MMALERAPLNNHTDRLADAERTDHRDDQEVACEREDRRLELESDGDNDGTAYLRVIFRMK